MEGYKHRFYMDCLDPIPDYATDLLRDLDISYLSFLIYKRGIITPPTLVGCCENVPSYSYKVVRMGLTHSPSVLGVEIQGKEIHQSMKERQQVSLETILNKYCLNKHICHPILGN